MDNDEKKLEKADSQPLLYTGRSKKSDDENSKDVGLPMDLFTDGKLNSQLQLNGTSIFSVDDFPFFRPPTGHVTFPLALTAAVTIFGSSFPHGWNTGVLNSPASLVQNFLNASYTARFGNVPDTSMLNLLWSFSMSIYLVGGCGGAFSAGWIADKFGRRNGLLACHIFGFISAFLFGFCKMANSFEMLILARLIVGFGSGAGSGLVPMYLTEIASCNIRGAMGVLHQLALTLGIFMSQLMGLQEILGNEKYWPVLLALTALPCLVSLVVLPFLPESPRYLLVNKEQEKQARSALIKFRGHEDIDPDIDEMLLEKEQAELEEEWTFAQLMSSRNLRMPLLLVCCLNIAQQLSGINVVFYYSTGVFKAAGIPLNSIQYAVLFTGVINVMMTGISVPLMEKSGRRPLLLWGMVVMTFSALLLTVALKMDHIKWMAYVSIICFVGFVIGFAIGLGSIPQFIGAELFRQGPRPPAMSLAGLLNWLANFTVGITFPFMRTAMGPFSFIPFIFVLVGFGGFFYKFLPETKGKTIGEIYNMFVVDEEEAAAAHIEDIPELIYSRLSLSNLSMISSTGGGVGMRPSKELPISPLAARDTESFNMHQRGKGETGKTSPKKSTETPEDDTTLLNGDTRSSRHNSEDS